ncbi:MAG: KpsF/GutQ family sugar-phosphate isomerase [Planctomycetes bacterium]|nr:KpsF/GutQ family sugar-phosphate isomerase [Planctomycetota bacterium]
MPQGVRIAKRSRARTAQAAARTAKPSANGAVDLAYAREVIDAEAQAVAGLRGNIGVAFQTAAEWILALDLHGRGRVVGSGIGKAGIVGQKVCATLASTGTPALFVHPVEALHGDLGMITAHDLLLVFSNSGESEEIARLLPALKKVGARTIAITGRPHSTLGRAADLTLDIGRIEEPCPLRLAPSASTTAMLALGDALALCVLKARGFTMEDYAALHPGGALGRKLMRAKDLMRTGARLALAGPEINVGEALERMSQSRGGAVVIVDKRGKLAGIFTDGDFRRLMIHDPGRFHDKIGPHMTSPCKFIQDRTLVAEAQELMAQKHINALPVVDKRMKVVGLLDIQDLVGWPVL